MEQFSQISGADPDALPPPYASLIHTQYRESILRPLINPTAPYPIPYVPKERPEDPKPTPLHITGHRSHHPSTYASTLLHTSEVHVTPLMGSAPYDETIDVSSHGRDSMSYSRKCCTAVVSLLVFGSWFVITLNLYSRPRTSDTF